MEKASTKDVYYKLLVGTSVGIREPGWETGADALMKVEVTITVLDTIIQLQLSHCFFMLLWKGWKQDTPLI